MAKECVAVLLVAGLMVLCVAQPSPQTPTDDLTTMFSQYSGAKTESPAGIAATGREATSLQDLETRNSAISPADFPSGPPTDPAEIQPTRASPSIKPQTQPPLVHTSPRPSDSPMATTKKPNSAPGSFSSVQIALSAVSAILLLSAM